jgi:sarcosine oxidase subunit beta
MSSFEVVVIGGGSTGASIAFHLARRGVKRVALVDKLGLAAGATGRSTAVVRTHYTFAPLARMALFSLRYFQQFGDRVGGESGFTPTGFLVIAGDSDAQALQATVEMNRSVGITVSMLNVDEVRALEPRLACSEDATIAAWEPESGRADPHATTQSFGSSARALGVDVRLGVSVAGVEVRNGRVCGVATDAGELAADVIVVAAGFRSRELLLPFGLDLGLVPVRHAIGIVQRTPDFGPPHPLVSDRVLANYYVPEGRDLTLIGSNAAWAGVVDMDVEAAPQPDAQTLVELSERFLQRFPGQDQAVLRGGFTGIYDCSPDLQPLLGPIPAITGLYVAAGFSGHGFKLCPAIGDLMAEHVLTGSTSLVDLEPFSPMRFVNNLPIQPEFAYSHRIDGVATAQASVSAET